MDDSEVTMYGDEKCDAMTWQKESCTFAVKMSTACSTDKAKKIVSGTKEENKPDKDTDAKVKKDEKHIASNAAGAGVVRKASPMIRSADVCSARFMICTDSA